MMHATTGGLTGIDEVVWLPLTPTRSRCRSILVCPTVVVCSEYFQRMEAHSTTVGDGLWRNVQAALQ